MRVLSFLKHLALAAIGLAALLAPLLPGPAHSAPLPGPVPAKILRVIDGDTVRVAAHVWIGQTVTIDVRLRGIDAPEIGAHAHCAFERDKADQAKAYLASLVEGRKVALTEIANDKYGGRVDARIVLADGGDASALMLKRGLAMSYDGGRKRPWCSAAAR
jgi:micrococcal nuclease